MTTLAIRRNWSDSLRSILASLWHDDAVRISVLVFLALRIFTLVCTGITVTTKTVQTPPWMIYDPTNPRHNQSSETFEESLPANSPLANIVEPFRRYDTAWYIKIAIQGYHADNAIVFPPLYPALIRLVSLFSGGNYVLAALVVSNVSCFIMLLLLFKLVRREYPDRRNGLATATLICLAAFPTAYYLVAGYTESLFLALTLGAYLMAYREEWFWSGVLSFFAALSRLQGAVLVLPMLWIAIRYIRQHGIKSVWRTLPAILGAPLGILAFSAYISLNNLGRFEDAFMREWALSTRMPWEAILTYIKRAQTMKLPEFEHNNAFALVLFIVLAIIVTIRMRPEYWLYVWPSLVLMLVRYHYSDRFPQLESIFRYVLVLFPCFIVAAMTLRRWWLLVPYAVIMLQWQNYLLDMFIRWIWVA